MLTVAYLANLFPSAVEPYVIDEIEELRRRGVRVIAGSVRKPKGTAGDIPRMFSELTLQNLSFAGMIGAGFLLFRQWTRIWDLIRRVLFEGAEGPMQRLKALLHTCLGAYYAALLQPYGVDYIHVHHGYFGSWIAMTAARLLNIGFSMTLHGSDLLLHGAFLDVKVANCEFCLTVSEYNRQFILAKYPAVDDQNIKVSRLGVAVAGCASENASAKNHSKIALLAVGRLQPVKDHGFLVRACAALRADGIEFECLIAGEGPDRRRLESLIRENELESYVTLLGHVPREQMDSLYDRADVLVLTSRSEGIPLVLMEAMARRKIVLAPAITGIPELVIPGETGFLYEPQSLDDFVSQLMVIRALMQAETVTQIKARPLHWVRQAARVQVLHNFNRQKNLESFCELFLSRITPRTESIPHEDFVLQQI